MNFESKKIKILEPLLKDNIHLCIDCNAVSSTFIFKLNQGSLDFDVFISFNRSGTYRTL